MRPAFYIAGWFLLCSTLSFALYGLDKHRARSLGRRIPERTLLLTCLVGGWPGAAFGARVFRHKTRKQRYRRMLFLAIAGNFAILAALAWMLWPLLIEKAT